MLNAHKKSKIIIALAVAIASFGFSGNDWTWQKKNGGLYDADIRVLSVDPNDPSRVYAGTSRGVYRSLNKGNDFQSVLRISGESKGVNALYIYAEPPYPIYAATDAGLFESADNGLTWQKIYFSSDPYARRCLSVGRWKNDLYLGTEQGLLIKSEDERVWRQPTFSLIDGAVYSIQSDGIFLYLAGKRSLYRWDIISNELKQVFTAGAQNTIDQGDEENQERLADIKTPLIKTVQACLYPKPFLAVASTKGIYVSANHGDDWLSLPVQQLPIEDVASLTILTPASRGNGQDSPAYSGAFLAGTMKGAFLYVDGQWMPVYRGMETNRVSYVMSDKEGGIYAATDRGVFYARERTGQVYTSQEHTTQEYKTNDSEPSIRDVQEMAIDYAEVNPQKIREWRQLAKKRAWLPSLNIGLDASRDWGSSDSIWGSYTSGGQHYIGPDEKNWGEDFGWDVGLSWDLGDLIWNPDQTSIDSRSKLMVELREVVLDQVTRLYFERRRLQLNLLSALDIDPVLKLDQQLRVDELTALLDGYTGGEFSKVAQERRRQEARQK